MKKISALLIFASIIIINTPLFSQFGKNKVQYDNFDWKYIQSSHFNVYYNAGSKELAEFTAVSGEAALNSIQRTLNYNIKDRINIIVYNSHNEFQQTNVIGQFMPEGVGGVTELYKNRVVLPFQGDYSQYKHVIHHELVHAVLNQMFYGGSIQELLSSNTGNFMIPTWMNEGFSEWESIGGMNTETDMFMRDLTIGEELPELDKLDGYTAYRAGQTFFWYIADKYGKEKVGDFFNRLRIYRKLDVAFKSCFNLTFEEFGEKWLKDIKKFYWPDLNNFDDPKDFAIPITNHEKDESYYNSSPAISPNGEKIAYISAMDGMYGIYIKELDKKENPKKLISSFRSQDFEDLNMLTPGISWSPDGKYLAISAKAGGEDAIFIVNEEDGDYDKLEFGLKSITSVQWSDNGDFLAFIGTQGDKSDIFIYNFKNKKLSNITEDTYSEKYLVWGKDNKSIFFISDRGNDLSTGNKINMKKYDFEGSDIYKINIEDLKIERITVDFSNNKTSIAVASDNKKILYVSDKNGIGNIYILNLNNNETYPITNSITGITQISLAKDNSKLLYSSQIKGGYDLFMLRYPLEMKSKGIELPLTQFKTKELENNNFDEKISSDINDEKTDDSPKYGNFEIDFSSQQLITANKDVNLAKNDIKFNDSANIEQEFVENDYRLTFSADLIQTSPTYNTFYGVQGAISMIFSDILGDHQIYGMANFLNDLKNSQINLQYFYLPKVIDYSINLFHNSVLTLNGTEQIQRFRYYGAGGTASLPFNLFDRIEFSSNILSTSSDILDTDWEFGRTLMLNKLEFVHDNTLWGMYAPHSGTRYNISLLGSPSLGENGLSFINLELDYRNYLPINNYMGFALRLSGGASIGRNPQYFYLGGTENWINYEYKIRNTPFLNPEDFVIMPYRMPMRGWKMQEITGPKYFVSNFEFRFPLITALVAGPLPVFVYGIMGNIFFDIGGAWDDSFSAYKVDPETNEKYPSNLLMSTGLGARAVIFGIPFKLDIVWTNNYSSWSQPKYLYSIGLDF